jgi:hypothetical protein
MSDKLNLFVAQQKLKRQVFEIWDDAVVEVLSKKDSTRRIYILRITRYKSLQVEIELSEQELLNEHNLVFTSVIPRLHLAWEKGVLIK